MYLFDYKISQSKHNIYAVITITTTKAYEINY